jgi:predicted phosphoadenosine phosphosulfate sulfurtransferase
MHQAGLTPHQMRICEPYGDEQRKGLWLYHVVEPETWSRVCARVQGANSGALYADESGNVLGNQKISLPVGHTWKSFADFLLETMPTSTAEHYRDKIAVYLKYCQSKDIEVPDSRPGDTGGKDVPSWRRICKTLLKNDYWCKGLSFSPQKPENFERYKKLMKERRAKWGLL